MKKKIYRSKYEAYPFLSDEENDLRCDFEIFTDEIASQIGLLHSLINNESLKSELLTICELVYHINPSLRTFVSVTQDEFDWLENHTLKLRDETKDRCNKFVLTQGCESACQSHIIRAKFKALVRMMYRYVYRGNNLPDILFDFANLLSNYFFYLSLKLNDLNNINEIEYQSRNYR